MEITVRESKSIPIIEISGEVDLYNTKDLKDLFDQMIKKGNYKIVLNLKNVPFMDSSGIGTIVTSMYKLRKYDGNLKVCNLYGSVAKVFNLTKINTNIEVFPEEEDAVDSFL